MKVLVIGSGGREHALAWKSAQDDDVSEVFVCPGNAGTDLEDKLTNIAIEHNDFNSIENFCVEQNIHLVIIGPEQPLVAGLAADSIGEKSMDSDESKLSFIQYGAIEALLSAVSVDVAKDGTESRITSMGDLSDFYLKILWTLRSLLKNSNEARIRLGNKNGIENMLKLLSIQSNEFERSHEIKTVALSILIESVVDNEKNSRRLLRSGLDQIIELAEKLTSGKGDGRLSVDDAGQLLEAVKDGGVYTDVEKDTMVYIRDNFKWTDAADEWFRREIRKWAGTK